MSALHRGYRTFAVHHEKAWFLRFSRSLLNTYLFSLCLEKKVYCFRKSLEKVVNFGSKNLYEPCLLKLLR